MNVPSFLPSNRKQLYWIPLPTPDRRARRQLVLGLALSVTLSACASRQAKRAEEREKIIPDSTQHESQQLQGQQEMFMGDLNQTTSEQAGARHDHAVLPKRDPDQEGGKKKQ